MRPRKDSRAPGAGGGWAEVSHPAETGWEGVVGGAPAWGSGSIALLCPRGTKRKQLRRQLQAQAWLGGAVRVRVHARSARGPLAVPADVMSILLRPIIPGLQIWKPLFIP